MPQVKIEKVLNKLAKNGTTKLCSIKTTAKNGEETWINGFGNSTTESWKEGQTVDLELYEEEYNGKMSWKFVEPEEISVISELAKINAKLDILLDNGTTIAVDPKNTTAGNFGAPTVSEKSTPQELADKVGGTVVEEIKVEDINW
jgi:hypothetical protein